MGKGIEKIYIADGEWNLRCYPILFIKQLYHPIGKSDFGNMNLRRVGVFHAHKVYAGCLLDHICTVGIKTKIHHHLLGAHRLKGFVLFFDKVIGQGLSSTVFMLMTLITVSYTHLTLPTKRIV